MAFVSNRALVIAVAATFGLSASPSIAQSADFESRFTSI